MRPEEPDKWAVKLSEAVQTKLPEKVEKPEPAKRSLKKHPSFESWIEGSPHDSDEYDTDLDIEGYVKSEYCLHCNLIFIHIHVLTKYLSAHSFSWNNLSYRKKRSFISLCLQ